MKWFNNLKIGVKLTSGFGIILLMLVLIAAFSAITAIDIDTNYSNVIDYPAERRANWVEVENRYNAIRSSVYIIGFSIGTDWHEDNSKNLMTAYTNDFVVLNETLNKLRESLSNDIDLGDEERAAKTAEVEGVIQTINKWREEMADPMIAALVAGDKESAVQIYNEKSYISAGLMENIESYLSESTIVSKERNAATTVSSHRALQFLLVLSVSTFLIGIILAVIITKAITKPISELVGIVDSVSEGKLDVDIDKTNTSKDEIGVLQSSVIKLIETILLIVSELERINKDFQNGDIKAKLDESLFKGSYKEVAGGVNNMFGTMIFEILNFIDALNEFGEGDFKAEIANANARTGIMVDTLNRLRNRVSGVTSEINRLVNSASVGQLNNRIDTKEYSGDWVVLLEGLNSLMEVISMPINEAAKIMEEVAVGNFANKVEGNYQGEFLKIKISLNNTITNIASYIEEISAVLDGIAKNNLSQNITREYVGEFADIKKSLNNIIETFNGIVSNILMSAEQVASGSMSISESSMSLAEGTTEQAASIQELNATVQTISGNTMDNAENAEKAQELSMQSKESASQGEQEMKKMLTSMDRIKESSNGISKIMKVIDDISFQTNLLALNAAVEAARAGEYGKGFAVVAEEVRTLAERSKDNAHETSRLIEESIERVDEGMEIARNTNTALSLIVESVSKVNEIISGITTASQEQALAISQVTEGIQQIAEVIQANSATSEETASASQELSSQAEMLKGMVDVFTLSSDRNRNI